MKECLKEWLTAPIPARTSPGEYNAAELLLETTAAAAGELLVRIPEDLAHIRCSPQYTRLGVPGAIETCWVRQTVLAKLIGVSVSLAACGLTLVIWDAWRPVAVQQALYDDYQAQLRRSHPQLSSSELDTLTREFVALPSLDPVRPSPHFTGGAVDVTLADCEGHELPLGTPFDDFTSRATTRYFEDSPQERPLTQEERQCRDHRRLLCHAMTGQGFINYEAEWWHFDYGNRLWARTTGTPAFYGPIHP